MRGHGAYFNSHKPVIELRCLGPTYGGSKLLHTALDSAVEQKQDYCQIENIKISLKAMMDRNHAHYASAEA